jgi:type IV secretion system protein VirB1
MFDGCPVDAVALSVPANIMQSIVHVESGNNPFAIGVVGDRLQRQPRTLNEATSTAKHLQKLGKNFSVGLAQVNLSNFKWTGIKDWTTAFDRCTNLTAGAKIFAECYGRSGNDYGKAISCYYSGNFSTGYSHGYVQKVTARMDQLAGKKNSVSTTTITPQTRIGLSSTKPLRPLDSVISNTSLRGATGSVDKSFIF